tara:strand:- start:6984 stop:7439 length:456 start_codon:yes stop_codon:yes gene_type:complete
MEWTRVDIESDIDIAELVGGLADLKVGLDTDAQSMHQEFMKGLPHLSEVQEKHTAVVSEIESRALGEEVSTLGEFVTELGGEWSENEIRIPLPSVDKGGFSIDTRGDGDSQLVRVISAESFGGMLRSFRLPEGMTVKGARWEGEIFSIRLD